MKAKPLSKKSRVWDMRDRKGELCGCSRVPELSCSHGQVLYCYPLSLFVYDKLKVSEQTRANALSWLSPHHGQSRMDKRVL